MSQNKYVLLCNDGTSHDCSRKGLFREARYDLADLLEAGWRPVHETPLGQCPYYGEDGEGGSYVWALILLVKD